MNVRAFTPRPHRRRHRPERRRESATRLLASMVALLEIEARIRFARHATAWRSAWARAEPKTVARVDDARAALVETGACIGCGCTDDDACAFGCYWIAPGWCSACRDRAREEGAL